MAISEDPDEMLHYAAFHLGLHYSLRQINTQYLVKEIQFHLEIIKCDDFIDTIDHPKFIVSNQKEEYNSMGERFQDYS